ncbi:MAG: Rha family transcriptional regulator [[Actinobacillus] rossii]|nr:Rha family transcriptional regulator [[Actinobacillus] rossii]
MNQLLNISEKNASTLTMSSREITKLVNSRHSDVCKSIETLISKGVIGGYQPKPYTHPQNGQVYHEYFLNKRDTYILVAQFSPEFTAAVIDRWQELENQQATALLPQNYLQALEKLVETEREKQALALENQEMKPKGVRDILNEWAGKLSRGEPIPPRRSQLPKTVQVKTTLETDLSYLAKMRSMLGARRVNL